MFYNIYPKNRAESYYLVMGNKSFLTVEDVGEGG